MRQRVTGNGSLLPSSSNRAVQRVEHHLVALRMTATVSSGVSHIGKCPLPSNQWSSAPGKAACARAACLGRQSRSCLPHPMTTRPVPAAAGPDCSGPVARLRTSASNVGVLLRPYSSVATVSPSSAQGRAES
jgi:hypothetical protein